MSLKISLIDPNRILYRKLTLKRERGLFEFHPYSPRLLRRAGVLKCVVVILINKLIYRILRKSGSGAHRFLHAAFRDEANNL